MRLRKFKRQMGLGIAGMVLCTVAAAATPSRLWDDIAHDRVTDVKTLLSRGTDPNAINAKGEPAIMQAIRDGAWGVYDTLASNRRTRVNITNIHDETPLMYLALTGQTKRAQALIARGAEVNRLGWTPLHYAASKGHAGTVKMLIARKAIINAPAPDGTTALMMAAFSGSEPVVRMLISAGADVTTRNLQGKSAVDWARLRKHDALAAKLDVMIKQTLDQRTATYERNRALEGGASGPAPATVPAAPRDAEPGHGKPDTSPSRYFDLKRFE